MIPAAPSKPWSQGRGSPRHSSSRTAGSSAARRAAPPRPSPGQRRALDEPGAGDADRAQIGAAAAATSSECSMSVRVAPAGASLPPRKTALQRLYDRDHDGRRDQHCRRHTQCDQPAWARRSAAAGNVDSRPPRRTAAAARPGRVGRALATSTTSPTRFTVGASIPWRGTVPRRVRTGPDALRACGGISGRNGVPVAWRVAAGTEVGVLR